MLPPLTADGVLPLGVYLAPVTEIMARFGNHKAVRRDMAHRLQRILALAQETGHLRRAFVRGSCVTAKPEPADVDLRLVMSADFRSEQCAPSVRQVFDPESLQDQAKGWLAEWQRLDEEIRVYLSTPAVLTPTTGT